MKTNIVDNAKIYAQRIFNRYYGYTLNNAMKIFGKYYDLVKAFYEELLIKDKARYQLINNTSYGTAYNQYKLDTDAIYTKYKSAFQINNGTFGKWSDVEAFNKELNLAEAQLHKTFSRDYKYARALNGMLKAKALQNSFYIKMNTKDEDYEYNYFMFYYYQAKINDYEDEMTKRIMELTSIKY